MASRTNEMTTRKYNIRSWNYMITSRKYNMTSWIYIIPSRKFNITTITYIQHNKLNLYDSIT